MPISFENYECYYFWQVNLNLDEVFIEKKISHEYRKYRINIENIAQIVQKYRKISKISYRLEYKR